MSKYFICLANSFKRVNENENNDETGRCIAGIEITYPAGNVVMNIGYGQRPNWIRPIAKTPTGAIPVADARNFGLFDIIKIDDPVASGCGAHSEDYSYSSLETIGRYNGPLSVLIDTVHRNSIFGSERSYMDDNFFQCFDHSLMLIRPEKVRFFYEARERDGRNFRKLRVSFHYGNYDYSLPVTDPVFQDRCYNLHDDQCTALNDGREYFFVMSLGMGMPQRNNRHYKLVAAVLYADV